MVYVFFKFEKLFELFSPGKKPDKTFLF